MKRALFCLALLSAQPHLGFGQQTGVSGSIADATGDVLVGAIVTITDTAGGASLSTVTNTRGAYSFPSLLPSDYRMRVEAPGFTPAERTFTLLVGQAVSIDLKLKPAAVATTVDVMEDLTEVDVTSSQIAGQVDPRQMRDVPLNGRNWMELALLVPGIVRNAVDQGSATEPIGKYQINVDGQQVTQNTAGTGDQAQYSREAIAQFQIITNRFDATLGRSTSIQVNAQTRSGSNDFHGSLYTYVRNDKFNAADKIAGTVLPYSNQQYGGTFGGPLMKDKLWFFAAYEGQREPATLFVTPEGFPGQSYTFSSQDNLKSFLLRLDYQRSADSRFSLRLNISDYDNPFTNVGGNSHPSRATSATRHSKGALVAWSKVISPALVSDAKLGFAYHSWTNDPLVPSQEYRLGSTTIGAPYNYPGDRFQNTFQFRDDLYWLAGKHNVKTGVEYLNTRHYGFFQQNARGVVTSFSSVPQNLPGIFTQWDDPSSWDLAALSPYSNSFVQGFGDFNLNVRRHTLGVWIQDDWKFTRQLTFNLGFRYDNDIGMLGNSPRLKSGLLVPEHGDNNNFSPRLGFAYDLTGSRRTVIRGGAGLYYADLQANQFYNQQLFNGETTIQAAIDAKPGSPINLAAPFGANTGDDFLNGTAPTPTQSVQLVSPDLVTPYTYQVSIGVEHALGDNWSVEADFVNWRLYHEWIRIDENLEFDPATGFNKNPNRTPRPDPRFTSILRFLTPNAAGAIYNGLQMQIRRRFANNLSLATAYTLSRSKDSSGGAFYLPNNIFDLAGEWANGGNDQRHTLNVNGSYAMKWGFQLSGIYRFGSGMAYGGRASGSPFANGGTNRTFLATAKTYNDPAFNTPAPLAAGYLITERNQVYGQNIHRVDMRLAKTFNLGERFRIQGIAEAFNLFNRANFGSYGAIVTSAAFSQPSQNSNLAYAARMLQFAGRFEF